MRTLLLLLLVVQPVLLRTECGVPIYDEVTTCVKICKNQFKDKIYAVYPISYPITEKEKKEVPQSRICSCYTKTERILVTDGVPGEIKEEPVLVSE